MTDLQLGLLLIGAAAVAGVLLYNHVQERAARRAAERVLGAPHGDVLFGEASGNARHEPSFIGGAAGNPAAADLPNPSVDYMIDLAMPRGALSSEVLERWQPVQQRFARRVMLVAGAGGEWRALAAGEARSVKELRAALQTVSRDGVVSDAELLEFRSAVETLGAKLGATVSAPEMRQALEAARELDRLCAEADIQVALHVIGVPSDRAPHREGQPFQVAQRPDGLTLLLDVARTAEPARSFDAMARAGRQLAAGGAGRLVDDNGKAVDERALAAIGIELQSVQRALAARGIEPGSPTALRLFS